MTMAQTPSDTIDAALARFFAGQPGVRRVVVALSGGMDSVVLLHALGRLHAAGTCLAELSALHVHHGLSPNADGWAQFCRDLCVDMNVALKIERVDVPRGSGEGLEAAARRCRHAAFAASDADAVALAHHRDDQAETVLLNLLRGAGVAGAAGMPAARAQRNGPLLIRPLLDVAHAVLEAYAVEHGLRWIDDESNANRHFRRNFLRHDVLPALEDKFPGARQSLARAAGHFGDAAQLLDELAALDLAAVRQPSGRIGLAAFNALVPARARNVLRAVWLEAGFRAPETRWVDEARRQLAATDAHSETCVSTPEGDLHVYRGELHCVPRHPTVPAGPLHWQGEAELAWAGGRVRFVTQTGAGIRRQFLEAERVELVARQGGERIQLQANRPRRQLRDVLREAAIPPWERERLPYLWIGGRLAWVGRLGVDIDFVCRPGEAGLLPVWEN